MRLQPRDLFEFEGDHEIFASMEVVRFVTNGITVDYTKVPVNDDGDRFIAKGMPMSKITASGKYRPYTGGLALAANVAGSATSATLNDVSRLVVGDIVTFDNGTNTEAVTITAINTTTKVITFAAITNAYTTANGLLSVADGGDAPSCVSLRKVNVKDGDHVIGAVEIAKLISARLAVTVDATLKARLPGISFA